MAFPCCPQPVVFANKLRSYEEQLPRLRDFPSQHITKYSLRIRGTITLKGLTRNRPVHGAGTPSNGNPGTQPVFSRYDVNTVRDMTLLFGRPLSLSQVGLGPS